MHAGADFRSLYAVKNGSFKTYTLRVDGRQQVTGFYMTGELLGLDAISPEKHTCDTVALVDSEVCEVPFIKLEEIGRSIPSLMSQFHKIMSREIVQDRGVMMLLGSMRAEERLAAFFAQSVHSSGQARVLIDRFYFASDQRRYRQLSGTQAGNGQPVVFQTAGRRSYHG